MPFRNANVPKPLNKGKGRLEKIDWGIHEAKVKEIWETNPSYRSGSVKSRMNKIQKLIGYSSNKVGYCQKCRTLNEFMIKYKVEGAYIIERFCSEHLPT